MMQTGADLVCSPDGELCTCYHHGWELLRDQEATTYDGDFIVCWLDNEPKEAATASTEDLPSLPVLTTATSLYGGICAVQAGNGADTRQ